MLDRPKGGALRNWGRMAGGRRAPLLFTRSQRPELSGYEQNFIRGEEDTCAGAEKLGIRVIRGPCGVLDWEDTTFS